MSEAKETGTLLIRLVGPMQAWGTRSKFDDRDTEMAPSKSGVLGLCAAALGIDRHDSVEDLAKLSFGVRVDRAGKASTDYHTAQLHPQNPKTKTDVTRRDYLADAAFWAALSGNLAFLQKIHAALQNPHWPLSLGRKSFQASLPLFAEEPYDISLWEALTIAPSLRRFDKEPPTDENGVPLPDPYLLVLDYEAMPENLRRQASPSRWQDVPAAPFAQKKYFSRRVLTIPRELTPKPDPYVKRNQEGAA